MALNLGQALSDAVDGPADGLDDLVGEDPADVDLPALSARIRHRRRGRLATRSALGVAAAGAVALLGVHGGLGSGALTYRDGAAAPLGAGDLSLCGRDVAAMPATDGAQLVSATGAFVSDGSGDVETAGNPDLGTLVGRTLTATLVQQDGATTTVGSVVLTQGSAVVAVGTALPQTGSVVAMQATDGSVDAYTQVDADLAPCPGAGDTDGDTGTVPSGTYTVQYLSQTLSPSGSPGFARSTAGPWLVRLLDAPSPVTLPDGFPAGEVPVVSGTLLSAAPQDGTGWTVQVAVDGDDALTRAVAALRHADAVVSESSLRLTLTPSPTQYPADSSSVSVTVTGPGVLQVQLAELQAELAQLQSQRDTAADEVAQGQQAYDELVTAGAQPDSLSWAARQLQTTRDGLAALEAKVQEKQLEVTTLSMHVDLDATAADQQQKLEAAKAAAVQAQAHSYTVAGPTSVIATTRSWSVDVAQSTQDGRTVLTYTLAKR